MKQLAELDKRKVAKDMRKGYMKLLSQQIKKAAKSVDDYFFVEGDEESEEIRPHFYGSLAFGIAVVIFVYTVIL